MIVNKLKRLILPSIIFSSLYFILFYEYKGVGNMLYSIVIGCGHMWFLPMLFWCFVGGWLLEQLKIKDVWKLGFVIVLNLFSLINLPLRLTSASIYFFYFYSGYLIYKYSARIKLFVCKRNLIVSWLVFIAVFIVFRPFRDLLITEDQNKYLKLIIYVSDHVCQLLYASTGLIAFFGTAVYYTRYHKLSDATRKLAASCFGIYLFQQFILQLLYYKTGFPILVGPVWLPILGFVLTFLISYFFTSVVLKTRIGKVLIG